MVWAWYAVSLAVIGLDQWSKQVALHRLIPGDPYRIAGWFDLTLAFNRGAAFSFLSSADGWQRWLFTVIALLVSGVLGVWLWRMDRRLVLQPLAVALIIGGALGNLIDRFHYGYVVDFISWHYQHWYWPAFNVADSAITVGAVLLIADMLRGGEAGADG